MTNLFKSLFIVLLASCINTIVSAQESAIVEGYAFENGNRGYLAVVQIMVTDKKTDAEIAEVFTDKDGFFSFEAPANSPIEITAIKDMFESKSMDLTPVASQKNFIQFELKRTPGYIFEITIAEKRESDETPVDAVSGTRIEVYNNTTKKEELLLEDYINPEFRVNLIKGNHYTILIRKKGFLAKRMEAFVDVKGCILCFEGIGSVRPGVSETMTEGNNNGLLLANVEMERVFEGKKMEVQNIYYDLDKWNIKPAAQQELNKVIQLMKDNPRLTLELGSHTDARGKSTYNQELSQKRAKAAVDYLMNSGEVRRGSITSRGYGESQITNKCVDGVVCSEKEHAVNRRTELKVTGFWAESRIKSLAQMKREKELESEILSGVDDEIELLPGETLEDALARIKLEEEEKAKLIGSSITPEDIAEAPEIKDGDYDKADNAEIVKHMNTQKAHSDNDGHDHKALNKNASSKGGLKVDVKNLSENATGIMISVHSGEERLGLTNKIYKVFSNLRLYETEEVKYYIINKSYDSVEAAQQYLDDNLKADYPDAVVVSFENGKIIK